MLLTSLYSRQKSVTSLNKELSMTRNNGIQLNPAKVLIAYHAHCIDGFTSAWVAAKAMQKQGKVFDLVPMEYGEKDSVRLLHKLTVETNYVELLVVDFSLSMDALAYLQEDVPKLGVTILDHHKTAFERYFPEVAKNLTPKTQSLGIIHGADIRLNNNECGASIVWGHFNPYCPQPAIVTYVEDYDLWRFELGDSTRYVNSYLSSRPKTLAEWDRLAESLATNPTLICDAGKLIYDAFIDECKEYAEEAVSVMLLGKEGLVVACPGKYASRVGNILAVHSGTFGATYIPPSEADLLSTGHSVKWSIRSNGDYDVSAIAKILGGGGHKNAAGFELSDAESAILLSGSNSGVY